MKNRLKYIIILIAAYCYAAGGVFSVTNNVYAVGYAGEGAGTGGAPTNCAGFVNGYQGLCHCFSNGNCTNVYMSMSPYSTCYKKNGETDGTSCGYFGGGTSWRIFSLDSEGYVPNDSLLDEYITVDTVKAKCRSIGAKHYVAYGWDRPYNRDNESAWGGHYYAGRLTGPVNRRGSTIQNARYNYAFLNGEAYTWNEIKDMTENDLNIAGASQPYGLKITPGAALNLYHRYQESINEEESRNIPNDVGYFCYGTSSSFKGDSAVLEVPENDKGIDWDKVSNNKKENTDWQDENKLNTPTYVVNNCDPEKGCWVSFRHYLKRMSGTGSTEFSIERELGDDVRWTVHSFTSDVGENVAANPVKMYPGQKLCETLSFYAKSDSGANVKGDVIQTRICAAAVATKESDISVQIRDESSSEKYHDSDWSKGLAEVYAKPGDNVELKGTYSPYYQSMYNTGISGSFRVNGFADENKSIGPAFDAKIDPNWKNAFSIKVGGQCGDAINGNIGSNNEYSGDRSYRVQGSDVGESNIKSGNAMTNCDNNMKNTPNSVGLTYSDENGFDVSVDIGSKLSNDVKIKVPYNFQNSTDIELSEKTIYAGESTTVSYYVIVGAKENEWTNGNYATPVPNASWGLEMKIGNGDWLAVSDSGGNGNLNSPTENGGIGYSLDGNREQKGRNVSIPVPDVPAGTEVCFRSWVSPSLSGANENLSESGFDKEPAWDEDCTKIAKRPSFQVWGGGMYSAGNLNLEKTLANKITLDGYGSGMYVFGSWAELSLVAEKKVTGLASGAGLGYGMTTDAGNASQQKAVEALGGRDSSDYCLMSTLSIANSDCNSAGVGNLGRSSGGSGDKSSLISDFVQEGDQFNIEGEFSLSGMDDNRKTDKGVYYYDGKDKDLSISASIVGPGVTKVVETNGLVTIKDNIEYENKNDNYSNLESIPKIIIYAKNINIYCGVTRVDAVLVADENINTCDGKKNNEDVNLEARSKQLMINGSVISNTLTLGRTYGAATGKNSVIPAEIINYDTSLYLWANNQSSATTSGKLTETYINELAPRY